MARAGRRSAAQSAIPEWKPKDIEEAHAEIANEAQAEEPAEAETAEEAQAEEIAEEAQTEEVAEEAQAEQVTGEAHVQMEAQAERRRHTTAQARFNERETGKGDLAVVVASQDTPTHENGASPTGHDLPTNAAPSRTHSRSSSTPCNRRSSQAADTRFLIDDDDPTLVDEEISHSGGDDKDMITDSAHPAGVTGNHGDRQPTEETPHRAMASFNHGEWITALAIRTTLSQLATANMHVVDDNYLNGVEREKRYFHSDAALSAKLIIAPMCRSGHWTVGIICWEKRTVEVYDAFRVGVVVHPRDKQVIGTFLASLASDRDWPDATSAVGPIQDDAFNCGVFILMFVMCRIYSLSLKDNCMNVDIARAFFREICASAFPTKDFPDAHFEMTDMRHLDTGIETEIETDPLTSSRRNDIECRLPGFVKNLKSCKLTLEASTQRCQTASIVQKALRIISANLARERQKTYQPQIQFLEDALQRVNRSGWLFPSLDISKQIRECKKQLAELSRLEIYSCRLDDLARTLEVSSQGIKRKFRVAMDEYVVLEGRLGKLKQVAGEAESLLSQAKKARLCD